MRKVGTQDNPINIFDEEEDQIDIQTKMEIARNKQLMEEAKLSGSPLDICFAVIKTTIFGEMKVKDRKLTKQILKYFKQKILINISCEHFYPRIQPDYSDAQTKPNPRQLILYGVDFLTTNAIKERFKILDTVIKQIFWINDSTCKIKYETRQQTDKIIKDQTNQIKIQEDNQQLPKGWFLIKPYTIFSFQRQLYLRYATDKQADIPKQNTNQYQLFYQAQSKLAIHLLTQFKAMDKFRGVVGQIQRDSQLIRRHRNSFNRSRSRDNWARDRYHRRQNNYGNQPQNNNNHNYRRNRHQDQDEDGQNPREHRGHRGHRGNERGNHHREHDRGHRYQQHNIQRSDRRRSYEPQMVLRPQIHKQVYEHLPQKMFKNNEKGYKNFDNGRIRQRVYFDSCQIDSNYSFNNFGSIRLSNEKDKEINIDFDLDRSDYDYKNENLPHQLSLNFHHNKQSMDKKDPIETSFNYNYSLVQAQQKQNQKDNNFDYILNESVLKVNKNANQDDDFFDINESGISEVHSKPAEQQIDISFNLVKQMAAKKDQNFNKSKNLIDNLDFNQDSY